ncbi:hypothetical protein EV356DRAFT_281196 [Viridothelium virens]|uniref:Methyltransferase type 11 domain-containing protein n=1 Tax=Viridothelium virens TaxID=1048519 RepID=A0A6A6H1H4_VIRVR|nr:hypothetical protein EV356DRAFT_281196 [Viridothelium virens]
MTNGPAIPNHHHRPRLSPPPLHLLRPRTQLIHHQHRHRNQYLPPHAHALLTHRQTRQLRHLRFSLPRARPIPPSPRNITHTAYSLLHIRSLAAGLEPLDCGPVLARLLTLLKPGGALQWVEPALDRYRHLRGESTSHSATLGRLSAAFFGGRLRERFAPRGGGERDGLPWLMREAGCERMETDVVSTDRVAEMRWAQTENGAVGLLGFVRMMAERGVPGAMTEQELREEIESGCYGRYSVHTVIGFEPKS